MPSRIRFLPMQKRKQSIAVRGQCKQPPCDVVGAVVTTWDFLALAQRAFA